MTSAVTDLHGQAQLRRIFANWWENAITSKVATPNIPERSVRLIGSLTLSTLILAFLFGVIAPLLLYPTDFLSHHVMWAGIFAVIALFIGCILNRRGNCYTAGTILIGVVMLCGFLATTDYKFYGPFWAIHGITSSSVLLAGIIFPQKQAPIYAGVMVLILTLLLPFAITPVDFLTVIYPLATVGIIFFFTVLLNEHRSQLEKERQEGLVNALQAAERLAAIVEGTSDLVASTHFDGRLMYLNTAGQQMMGLTHKTDLSKMVFTQLSPSWANEIVIQDGIPAAMRGGTWTGETAFWGADGKEIPASQTIIVHRGHDGTPDYMSTIVRDISEHKQAESRERLIKELQAAKRVAEENSRLKSEFLAMMSHELRTPLNAIEGFTSVVLKRMGGAQFNEKTEDYLKRVHSNSRRLLQLINDFLDLSRVEAGRLELSIQPFVPEKLAQRWRDEIGVLADKKGIKLELSISPAIPEVIYGDEEAISKMAINLLGNAIKFTEQGSVTLALECQKDTWKIAVTDTGIGIPPHAREYIFEEFRQVDQTSKRKYGGTGLGLAIVQKYARSMGGSVSLKSELGQGSTFTITLPLKTTA